MSRSCRELGIYCKFKLRYGLHRCFHALEGHWFTFHDRMLAVMTLNVGYFLSVLGGIFLGELAVGRYTALEEH